MSAVALRIWVEGLASKEEFDAGAGMRVLSKIGDFIRSSEPPEGFPGNAALLVLDMQRYFLDPSSHAYLPAGQGVIGNINRLAEALHEADRPVVYSRHGHREGRTAGSLGRWWGGLIMKGDPLWELHPDIALPEAATVIGKETYDMFEGTSLDRLLMGSDTRTVVVCGVMTHLCVETTARSAYVRNLDVVVPVDCCATSNLELHLSALRTLADGFAAMTTCDDLLALMGGDG